MSIYNLLASISAASNSAAPDSVANTTNKYLHELRDYVQNGKFKAHWPDYGNEWCTLVEKFGGWSFLACAASVVIIIVLWCLFRKFPSRFRDVSLKWGFVIVWIFGFIVYDIGTCTGEYFSLFTNAPMAILHSLGMFLLESDVSAIHEPFHSSWIYMMLFSFAHMLAAVVSTLFVIKHFGYHISAGVKLLWASSMFGRKKDETYVFWGLNEPTFQMIKSIKKHYGRNKNYRIIVVRSNKHGDDSAESRSGFSRIFSFLALRNSELEKLQSLKCLSTCTNADSTEINPDDKFAGTVDIIGRELNLRSVRKILANKTLSKIHMLFLSDNASENLHDVALLLGDKTIKEFANRRNDTQASTGDYAAPASQESGGQVRFYCHARYNSVHRVIEDLNSSDNIMVNVIDSSHINVEMLKSNKDILPVNFVDVKSDATVSSPFNAMVVGFSEVGLDSARFLYEFGAFVKSGSDDQHVERSGFHLDVIDRKMSALAGTFVANAPAIKPSLPFIEGRENNNALITLHEMDCCSAEFYLMLEEKINKLNYIVIATDDDELNISLGVRIFKIAARYRNDMEKFCILVRAHNDDDGHIRKIALHYNRLWAAQKAAVTNPIKDMPLNQNTVKRDAPANLPIYLFGLDKQVYTYNNIIDDSLEQEAIKFKEEYEASTNPEHKYTTEPGKRAWELEFNKLMQLDDIYKDGQTITLKSYYPTYGGLMRLRRTQGQDFANCLHKMTKKLLAEKALKGLGMTSVEWEKLSRKEHTTTYTLQSGESVNHDIVRILDVLAQTEHLRWNASHEIFGYKHTEKCDDTCNVESKTIQDDICDIECGIECNNNLRYKDEVRLIHNCIRDWQNLDTKTKSYDYNVVDVTLNIINPNRPLKK